MSTCLAHVAASVSPRLKEVSELSVTHKAALIVPAQTQ